MLRGVLRFPHQPINCLSIIYLKCSITNNTGSNPCVCYIPVEMWEEANLACGNATLPVWWYRALSPTPGTREDAGGPSVSLHPGGGHRFPFHPRQLLNTES